MMKAPVGTLRAGTSFCVSIAMLALAGGAVQAASERVRNACTSDYLAYCSRHPEEGPAVRACMNANGSKLSKRCVDALIADGEISKGEVERRRASSR